VDKGKGVLTFIDARQGDDSGKKKEDVNRIVFIEQYKRSVCVQNHNYSETQESLYLQSLKAPIGSLGTLSSLPFRRSSFPRTYSHPNIFLKLSLVLTHNPISIPSFSTITEVISHYKSSQPYTPTPHSRHPLHQTVPYYSPHFPTASHSHIPQRI
jgi:hypothetical protein